MTCPLTLIGSSSVLSENGPRIGKDVLAQRRGRHHADIRSESQQPPRDVLEILETERDLDLILHLLLVLDHGRNTGACPAIDIPAESDDDLFALGRRALVLEV